MTLSHWEGISERKFTVVYGREARFMVILPAFLPTLSIINNF